MPTPFMHLRAAEQVVACTRSPSGREAAGIPALEANLPAFYLGHIAPDFQTLANKRRSATHFHLMPPVSRTEAIDRLLEVHPHLAAAQVMPPDQAAFVAGYLGHLQLDLIWHFDVVVPYFLQAQSLSDPYEAHRLHLLLLAYLDRESQEALPASVGAELAAARPANWAPFASDEALGSWRDFVAAQLHPGAGSKTIEIYAARLHMAPEFFAALLDDESWLADRLFPHVPVTAVREQLDMAFQESANMTRSYLRGTLQEDAPREMQPE